MIDVREHGARGPTVLVLHGGPGAPGSVASLARALASDFRALEPLQRRAGGAPLTVERHVADLAEICPERAAIVGWSWGAMLALSFAARHPDRVAKIALVGCGTYDEASRAEYRRRMDARLGDAGRARARELKRALELATEPAERDRILAEIGALATRAQDVDAMPEEIDDALEPDALGHHETWNDAMRLQREGVEPASFAAIRARMLMLHGDDDPHPGEATRHALARFVPRLGYCSFARCGHRPWLERAGRESFFAVLREFIERPY